MPFQIEDIFAENWVHYKVLRIEFSKLKDNLIFIIGKNLDTSGSTSNGCGKSVIGDLITDLLFDKTIRRHSPDSFTGKFKKSCFASMTLRDTFTKDEYHIAKHRNHPKFGDKVYFQRSFLDKKGQLNSIDLSSKKKADTYKTISKVLGINWDTFRNRNYFGQGDNKRFLNVTDAQKVQIIIDIQNLDPLRNCKALAHEIVKAKNKELDKKVYKLEELRRHLKSMLASKKLIEGKLKDSINSSKKELIYIKKEASNIDNKKKYAESQCGNIEDTRESFNQVKPLLLEIDIIKDEILFLDKNINKIKNKLQDDTDRISECSVKILSKKSEVADLKNLKTKRCDKCGANLNETRTTKSVNSLIKEVNKLKSEKKKISEDNTKRKSKLKKTFEEKERFKGRKAALVSQTRDHDKKLGKIRLMEKWEAMIPSYELESKILDKRKDELGEMIKNPSGKDLLLMEKKNVGEKKEEIKSLKQDMKKDEFERDKNLFSETVYEKSLRKLFEDFLENLNIHSNTNLEILSDNDIEVQFLPRKEKGSKEVVDKINVVVSVNGDSPRDFRTYSGGEKGKIEISTQCALFFSEDNSIPFMFLDEPFIGIDKEGRDRVVEFFREKADEGTQIMVVSHDDLVWGHGGILNVTKENGESKVEVV